VWLFRAPQVLDPWVPGLADAVSDIAHLAPWRGVAGFAPILGLVVGILAPLFWPTMPNLYSESVTFMALAIGSAVFSGAIGLSLLVGYVVGDLARAGGSVGQQFYAENARNPLDALLRGGGSQVVGYMLLAVSTVSLPRLASTLVRALPVPLASRPLGRPIARAVLHAVTCGLLIYLWCQGAAVLLHPVFTWRGADEQSPESLAPLRQQWLWLVLAAMFAAFARAAVQEAVRRHPAWGAAVARVRRLRSLSAPTRGVNWRGLPMPVRIGVPAVALTLVLAGAYRDWHDAIPVGGLSAGLGAWRAGLFGPMPPALRVVQRVAMPIRLLAAPIVAYVGFQLPAWVAPESAAASPTRSLLPAVLLTLAACHVLFPNRAIVAGAEAEEGHWRRRARRVLARSGPVLRFGRRVWPVVTRWVERPPW
jgi:hypothetical protein